MITLLEGAFELLQKVTMNKYCNIFLFYFSLWEIKNFKTGICSIFSVWHWKFGWDRKAIKSEEMYPMLKLTLISISYGPSETRTSYQFMLFQYFDLF